MNAVGIIAEYNPFHTGHQYQIASLSHQGETPPVVAAMSGNWVQSGQYALADKWVRAKLALMGGVDLVLELPTPWAISSAETFAQGGVEVLQACGVVHTLSFGSESGHLEGLMQVAQCLEHPEYHCQLKKLLPLGDSFPACRQRAVAQLLGQQLGQLLAQPNNNLGIEYLRAIQRQHSTLQPHTVLRQGGGHNSISSLPALHRSATQLRRHIWAHQWDEVRPYLHPKGEELLRTSPHINTFSHHIAQRLWMARLRTLSPQDWAKLPDGGQAEGLPYRLARSGQRAATLEEFFQMAKTKRYPLARLRRLALWAYLGLDQSHRPESVPYLRVLGFTPRGQALLAQMRTRATLPILVKGSQAKELGPVGYQLFQQEVRCTDLFDLLLPSPGPGGREWSQLPIQLSRQEVGC